MPRFKVGQIVFVLSDNSVEPAQIIAVNKQTTLNGTKTTFEAKKESGNFVIDENNCSNVFDSSRKIKDHLINNVIVSITQIVDDAELLANKLFKHVEVIEQDDEDKVEQIPYVGENTEIPQLQTGTVKVRLPDGEIAEVHMDL